MLGAMTLPDTWQTLARAIVGDPEFAPPDVVQASGVDLEQARQLWRSLHGKEPYKPNPMPAFYADVSRSFGEIAKDGGGELISLDADRALIRSVFELTFGSRWKVEMAKYLKEVS